MDNRFTCGILASAAASLLGWQLCRSVAVGQRRAPPQEPTAAAAPAMDNRFTCGVLAGAAASLLGWQLCRSVAAGQRRAPPQEPTAAAAPAMDNRFTCRVLAGAAASLLGWQLCRSVAAGQRRAPPQEPTAAATTSALADDARLWDIWLGSQTLPAVTTSIELGVFETLRDGSRSVGEVAASASLGKRGASMLLRVLVGIGLVHAENGGEAGDGEALRYALSDVARRYVLAEAPCCWNAMLLAHRGESHKRLLSLLAMDKNGAGPMQAWEQPYGMNATVARSIVETMHAHSASTAAGLAATLRALAEHDAGAGGASASSATAALTLLTRRGAQLLDVGGGSGIFAVALARAFPALACTVLELDDVVPVTEEYIAAALQAGAAGASGGGGDEAGSTRARVAVAAGSFFDDPACWPHPVARTAGGAATAPHDAELTPAAPRQWDAVLLSNVLHDWPSATNSMLLRGALAVLRPGGAVILHEALLPDAPVAGPTALAPALLSLQMLCHTSRGGQLTEGAARALLVSAGFEAESVIVQRSSAYHHAVVARKPLGEAARAAAGAAAGAAAPSNARAHTPRPMQAKKAAASNEGSISVMFPELHALPVPTEAGGRLIFVTLDVETTGSRKARDRVVEIGVVVTDGSSSRIDEYLGVYESRVADDGVPMNPHAQRVHGISTDDLRDAPTFPEVWKEVCALVSGIVDSRDVVVLTAFNGKACDFPHIGCELLRYGLSLPPSITHLVDTLELVRKFKGELPFHSVPVAEWPLRTTTGRRSLSCGALARFLLRRDGTTWEAHCGGKEHNALADAKGEARILRSILPLVTGRAIARPVGAMTATAALKMGACQ